MKWEITIKYGMGNNNNAHLTAHGCLKVCLMCENNMSLSLHAQNYNFLYDLTLVNGHFITLCDLLW